MNLKISLLEEKKDCQDEQELYIFIFLGTRLLAVDDDLRTKASECIQTNFTAVLQTREFHTLPTIKLELIGKKMPMNVRFLLIDSIRFHNA